MIITIDPKKIACFLFSLAVALLVINIISQVIGIALQRESASTFLEMAQAQSVFRLLTTLLLLICATLALLIATIIKTQRSEPACYWWGICLIFLFMAIVKNTNLDEQFALVIGSLTNLSRPVMYLLVYGIALVIIPIFYAKFLLHLPKRILNWLIAGTITFLSGAFILDMVTSYLWKTVDHRTVIYIAATSLEVLLEISGIIILIYTFLTYIVVELKLGVIEVMGRD